MNLLKIVLPAPLLLLAYLTFMTISYANKGYDAGYEWAELHDITDTDYDNGKSESFNEGVRDYAEEMQEEDQDE